MSIHEVLFPTFSHWPCPGMPVTRKQLVYPLPSQSSELLPLLHTFNLPLLSQSLLWPPVAQIHQPSGLQEHL